MRLLKYLNNISVWWHAVGTFALVVAILAKAPKHQSGKFVFQTFIDGTGPPGDGWGDRASHAYVVVVGILMAQYTLTGKNLLTFSLFIFNTDDSAYLGFDASAHVCD